ncbi:MAG: alpha/beta fold hydrolase [Propionibacteriales bacterium]|nr:alpha/beta fold hydrolase [Propionibacteriales bacterium]
MTSSLHTTAYGEHGSRVVFLHGLFGQGRNWTAIAKALASEHRVLLVDLPDHGRSAWTHGPPQGKGFDLVGVADVIAVELATGAPVALVGHSLGGKVAMVLALRHPALVERLCVADMSPVAYTSGSEFSGYIEAMRAMDLGALAQRADADSALRSAVPNPTVRSFLLQNLRRDATSDGSSSWRWQPNLEGLQRDLPGFVSWPAEQLTGCTPYDGPVLWVGGANSEYIVDEYAPAMDRYFPRNRRVTIKNAGHWLHSEQPEVFVEVLRRFLT